jgi:hypothetical protein
MAERHLDRLFSEAYDGALEGQRRARFDEHLATCERCAAAFADYAAALDVVRTAAPARMPVPVHLPPGAPQPQRARFTWPAITWSPARIATAATGLAAAAALVIALSVTVAHRGNSNVTLGVADNSAALGAGAPALAVQGFTNRTTVTVPGHPGETLLLATDKATYAPGETVHVIARLLPATTLGQQSTASSSRAVDNALAQSVPVVRLITIPSAPTGVHAGASPGPAGAPAAPVLGAGSAFADASPLPGVTAVDGSPVLVVTVPLTLHPGDHLELVVVLEPSPYAAYGANAPGAQSTQMQPYAATLTLTVG